MRMTGLRTFVELFLIKKVTFDEIDDFVEDWQDGHEPAMSLHEYLGMSPDEYKFWVEKPEEFRKCLITARSRIR